MEKYFGVRRVVMIYCVIERVIFIVWGNISIEVVLSNEKEVFVIFGLSDVLILFGFVFIEIVLS